MSNVENNSNQETNKLTREDLLKVLEEQIEIYERLPEHAKMMGVNHYDMLSMMIWLSSFFKLED